MRKIWSFPYTRPLLVIAAMAVPWLISFGSYAALESWAPGVVSTPVWEWFSTIVFLAAAIACVYLVSHGQLQWSAKIAVSALLFLGGLFLAAMFQVHSTCGDYSPYVGKKPAEVVATCA